MKALKIVGVVLAIAVVAVYFTSDFFIERRLRGELSKLINKDSIGLYTYDFSGLNLNLVTGSIRLKGIKLYPTEAALDSIKNPTNSIRVLVKASCDEIKMEGFEIKQFLQTGYINIDRFIMKKPTLMYLFNSKKKGNKNSIALDNVLSRYFVQADLKYFLIDGASIKVHNINKDKDIAVFNDVGFHLSHVHIDSTTIKRFSPFDYENIDFSARQLVLDLDEEYTISTGKMHFNAKENTTDVSDVKVSPKHSRENFARRHKFQNAWFALTFKNLAIRNINFEVLIQNGDFIIEKLMLKKANLAVYKDKTKPEPPFKKRHLPVTALKTVPFSLSIDTVEVKNSTITINEKSALSNQVGELTFNHLNAHIYDFSNDSTQMKKNKFMLVNANFKIMKAAPVSFQAKFDLTSPTDKHFVHATVGKTDATVFNKLLSPLLLVKIKSGEILKMDFAYTADDNGCEGKMDFEYEDFKIDIYNSEEHDKKQGLLSLAANTVIKSTNKKESGSYSQGVIKTERAQNKAIFPYIWNAVQSGIVYTMAPIMSDVKKEEKATKKGTRKN